MYKNKNNFKFATADDETDNYLILTIDVVSWATM